MTACMSSADPFLLSGKQLIFLVGIPRSGTTWLQSMLAAHTAVGSAQESHLFNHYIGPLLQRWQENLQFDDGREGIGLPAYLTQQQFEHGLSQLVYHTLSQTDEFNNNTIFIEKTPDHLVHVDQIARLIPSSRFIYLQRNKYDVIESLLAAGNSWGQAWAPSNVVSAIRLVNSYQRRGLSALRHCPNGRVLRMSYERLRSNPRQELTRALQFIGAETNPEQVEALIHSHTPLKRYGEFAKRNGGLVKEPPEFRRKQKRKLSWLQRLLISLTCRDSSIAMPLVPCATSLEE